MEFFEFLENLSDNGFLYYQDKKVVAIPNDGSIDCIESYELTDIVPFVFDLPNTAYRCRFSPRLGTYIEHMYNKNDFSKTSHLPYEDIYDFLKRASQ